MATIIVDTGPLAAAGIANDPQRAAVMRALRSPRDRFVAPAPVTQEVDYLLGTRAGPAAQQAFLTDIADGRLRVECLERADYAQIIALSDRYRALRPGLADLSIVVLAARFDTRRILTFDQRHFRAMAPLQGGSFILLPWDEA